MSKKILLTGIMFLSIGLVGCQNGIDDISKKDKVEYSDDVKDIKLKKDSLRISYSGFKIDIPNNWGHINVNGSDVFNIPGRSSNISIDVVDGKDVSLDSYINESKSYVANELKVQNIEEEDITVGKYILKSIIYNYTVKNNDAIYIYQTAMKVKDKIYVFTLVSNENGDSQEDVNELKNILETIK